MRDETTQLAAELKSRLAIAEKRLGALEDEMNILAGQVPNDTHPDVPIGPEENVCVRVCYLYAYLQLGHVCVC